jgi:tetratricopeptide (TPR) repeat protein
VPPSDRDPIHLTDYVWNHPDVQRLCQTHDAPGLLALVHRDCDIKQARIAHWMQVEATEVTKLVNHESGRTGRPPQLSLSRWQRIADALNMPDTNRLLLGLAPRELPSKAEPAPGAPETRAVHVPSVEITASGDDMQRRELLRLLAVAGTTAVLPSDPQPWQRLSAALSGVVTTVTLDELAGCTAGLFDLEMEVPSSTLYAIVVKHLDGLSGRIETAGADRQLVSLAGETAALAGWLAFDRGHHDTARAYYETALDAARQAEDLALISCILGYQSYLPADRSATPTTLLERARELAERSATPMSRAWLAARHAEEHVRAGNVRAAMAALDDALTHHQRAEHPDRSWTYFFDLVRLDGMAAATYARLGCLDEAEQRSAAALARLSPGHAKKRALILVDTATAYLECGKIEEACEHASAAVAATIESDYGYGADRLRQFRALLGPRDGEIVRRLDGQIAAVPQLARMPA